MFNSYDEHFGSKLFLVIFSFAFSRKGRAKSSGSQSRNRDDVGASSEMSREGGRSPEESQAHPAVPAASDRTG